MGHGDSEGDRNLSRSRRRGRPLSLPWYLVVATARRRSPEVSSRHTMPPPKQKPTAASLLRRTRRWSSVTPAFMRRLGETPQRALPQPLAAGADLPSEVVGAVDRLAHALVHVEIAVGREPP